MRPRGRVAGLDQDLRGRHVALRLEGTVMTLRCMCGREYAKDFGAGPVSRRVTGIGLELIFKRFQDGCSAPPCQACRRHYRKHGDLPPKGGRA